MMIFMKSVLGLFLLGWLFAIPSSHAMSVEEIRALMLEVNPAENQLTLQIDSEGKVPVLKFGRKIPVNTQRYIIQTQAVRLDRLQSEAGIDQIGSQFQPWIKVRCRRDRSEVQVTEQVFVDDEEIELESTEEYLPVMVIPCDIYEVERFAAAFSDFLKANQ